jgi:molecular chaperone DnaK
MSPPVGIDLGTTFSAIASVDGAGIPLIIPNQEGENLTPSAVLIDGDHFVVGRTALSQASARPGDVARWVKRQMGSPDFKFQGRYTGRSSPSPRTSPERSGSEPASRARWPD